MVRPTLVVPYQNDRIGQTGTGTLDPTTNLPAPIVPFREPGVYAVAVEESTTNYHPCPYATLLTTFWNSGTRSLDPTKLPPGMEYGNSYKVSRADRCYIETLSAYAQTTVAGDVWSVSGWVYHEELTPIQITIRTGYGGDALQMIEPFTWTYLSRTLTVVGTWPLGAYHSIATANEPGITRTIWAAGFQLEKQGWATSLTPGVNADGSVKTGYAWVTTPHQGNSTRATSAVRYATAGVIEPNRGAVVITGRMPERNGVNRVLMDVGNTSVAQDLIQIRQTAQQTMNVVFYSANALAGSLVLTQLHGVPLRGEVFTLYVDWDGAAIRMRINGGMWVTGTRSAWGLPFTDPVWIGSNRVGGVQWNEPIHSLAVYDMPLTDVEWEWVTGVPGNLFAYDSVLPIVFQGPTGSGGIIEVDTRVYLATKTNQFLTEITPYVLDFSYDWDIDRDGPKALATVVVTDSTVVPNFGWVAPVQTITYEDGTSETSQLGLYRLVQPSEEFDGQSVEVTMKGFDVGVLVSDRTLESEVYLTPGVKYVDYIRDYLDLLGMRHSIPDRPGVVPVSGWSEKVGVSWSVFLNQLCSFVGLYSLCADQTGTMIAVPIPSGTGAIEPSHTYVIGDNSTVVDDLKFDPKFESVFNQVIVIRDDPSLGSPLVAVRNFDDPDSPISTVNLGVKSKPYIVQGAADQSALESLADKYILDRTMYVNGVIETLPSLKHVPHEVVYLDLSAMPDVPGAMKYDGRYYVKGVSYDLMSTSGTMIIEIRRVEYFA